MHRKELLRLIGEGESQTVEFKERFPDQAREMAKEIAAFATSNEGMVLVGVSDDGKIKGIGNAQEKDQLVSRLEGVCKNVVKPPVTPKIEVVAIDDALILVVRVPRGDAPLYFVDGVAIVRHLTSARPAEPHEITQLVLSRSRASGLLSGVNTADFAFARTDYLKTRIPDHENGRQIGFWIAATPIGDAPSISRPVRRKEIWAGRTVLKAKPDPGGLVCHPLDGMPAPTMPNPEPLQGGASQTWHKRFPTDGLYRNYADDLVKLVVRGDGRISLVAKTSHIDPIHLNMRWIVADIANVMRVIDNIRTAEAKPYRYMLGVELRYDEHTVVDVTPVVSGKWILSRLEDDSGRWGQLQDAEPVFLEPKEFRVGTDGSEFIGEWLDDLHDLCGTEPLARFTFDYR
ncbi:MAG: hypothetical protein C0484_12875 [Rhodospirillum sp.]|nr:hypothetical protein [Rhodospirillum sp.]